MTTTRDASAALANLKEEIESLPAQRPIAARIVTAADDDTSSAADLGRLVSNDPTLTMRVMKLANSVFYGMSGRVRAPQFAITVIGFSTVRGLAVAALAGLSDASALPPLFWERSTATAIAANLVARRVGATPQDAFCAGLLLRLGQGMLYRCDRERYAEILEQSPNRAALLETELAVYGSVHSQVSADALAAWSFPSDLTQTLSLVDRRGPIDPAGIATRAAVEVSERLFTPGHVPTPLERLTAGRCPEAQAPALLDEARAGVEDLVRAFVSS